jgi:mono/diheme cytochrome c family protein
MLLQRFLLISLIVVLGIATFLQSTYDNKRIARGRNLALSACAYCHIAEPGQSVQPIASVPAPTFQDVADNPSTTDVSLRTFLRNPHAKNVSLPMPDPRLDEDQLGDIAAYIMSLRKVDAENTRAR